MKNKVLLKSVLCLLVLVLVGGGIITAFGVLLRISEEERLLKSIKSFMKTDNLVVLYDAEEEGDLQHKIAGFNSVYGTKNSLVTVVWQATGGEHNGGYLIESVGRGYNQSPIRLRTGLDKNGVILGFKTVDIGSGNTYQHLIDWQAASDNIKNKTQIESGSDIIANSGATRTLDGAAEAVNLAVLFYKNAIKGVKEMPSVVTDSVTLARLNNLFEIPESLHNGTEIGEFIKYPVTMTEKSVMGGKARVTGVYLGDKKHLILEVKSSYAEFGGWTLLVLIGDDGKVAAINPLANEIYVSGSYDASALDSAAALTSDFAGLGAGDIGDLDEYLQGTTGATETNTGLKLTVFHALSSAGEVRAKIAEFDAESTNDSGADGTDDSIDGENDGEGENE